MKKTLFNPHVQTVLQDLKSLLTYHRSSGIEGYSGAGGLETLMKLQGHLPQESRVARDELPVGKTAVRGNRPIEPKLPKEVPVKVQKGSMQDISNEVATCKGCNLSKQRIVPVAGYGGEKVRLLVVGDWLAIDNGKQPPNGSLFGIEQDRMLGKMIAAIKLPRNLVFVTNVIKCGVPSSCQPKAEHVHSCLSYLHRQISVVQPEVIITMGMIATRALLNRRDPMSRLRGRLLSFTSGDGKKIPLIATYHPTFLLQNPEMKKATWVDLQLLAKQLGLDAI